MCCHFTAAKGTGPVRGEQYRLFLHEYPHLGARVIEQCIADQKRTIPIQHLLPEVETKTIRMLMNHSTAGAVEAL